MKTASIAAILTAMVLSGCGTYARGAKEDVRILTRPTGARITTSLGDSCPRSPCTFKVPRSKSFDAFAKKPGYSQGQVHIATKVSKEGALKSAGNLLLPGGSVGLLVDAVTGAPLDHVPNPATIVLKRGKGGAARREPGSS